MRDAPLIAYRDGISLCDEHFTVKWRTRCPAP